MSARRHITVDGNEAAASVAHRMSEVIAIYPITPSSTMGELADEWSSQGRTNLWGNVPQVLEMQSEAGAAGAVHGALQAGALCTTFTASQGLLLMIPNLYKIAGELTPFTMHVAARTIATHALSIFGDHSDVMACRQTGLALLGSSSAQEAHDFAAIAHAATLEARIPFLHFFDGFRTSHEVTKIEELNDDDLRALVSEEAIAAHRARALTPDRPVLRGTAQNPDAFFQAREAGNPFYDACPRIVEHVIARFAALTGRQYGLFEYAGHPEAERVIVLMGSGAQTAHETVDVLTRRGERVGLITVRLFRPFSLPAFLNALPATVRTIAVLDRTKEPGSLGEPLYQDVVTALTEARVDGRPLDAVVVGGRYGLSSKEFTPAMVKAVFDNLVHSRLKNHFTVGITDDVTHTSLPIDEEFRIDSVETLTAVFYGLGADGTVSANKNSIKIIGAESERHVQAYFVYDSKKSGAMTVSHLRIGPQPIGSAYLITDARFVACHQFEFIDRLDVLEHAAEGATFLLNAPLAPGAVWDRLPREMQQQLVDRHIRMYAIDAYSVARNAGIGGRINTIMQICFFAITEVLPLDVAIPAIKKAIEKTYGKRGAEVVARNCDAVDAALAQLHEIPVPTSVNATRTRPPLVPEYAPEFVQKVTAVLMAGKGDLLPVSAFPVDGTWPVGTARWEKRNIGVEIPVWDPTICIQCNQCALVCPHATIRAKVYDAGALAGAPTTFKSTPYKGLEFRAEGAKLYTIQVAPEDCTGCALCVKVCPAKDRTNPRHKAIDMQPQAPLREPERDNYAFFLDLPERPRAALSKTDHKTSQFLEPLFEYSGACAGCGETPYIKLLTQLFGDRLLIANATGCTSIYGGNLPTTPYTTNRDGRGPAWSNSLFEDNAEFGLGIRLGVDSHVRAARTLLEHLASSVGERLATELLSADQSTEQGIVAQRERVQALRRVLALLTTPEARRLEALADYLVKKSVWLMGGDGWAYDIGYGGLDHVLANRYDVNILVLDTEVYSNTGGQQSKATPLGAAAKFAVAGKPVAKKDLGLLANMYGHVYVARIAFGAKMSQTVQAFLEAEAYPGPSLIIAYSHCIAHGYDMAYGATQQKLAVDSGVWPLFRFDPRRIARGEPPMHLDYGPPKTRVADYMRNEARFRVIERTDPARFKRFVKESQEAAQQRYAVYQQLAGITVPRIEAGADEPGPSSMPETED